ncbi:MAG: arsenate reductase ArsC [Pseudomonadota bacterium]
MSRRFLFICTHNRCRSILAEAITRQLGDGQIEAASAGSQPAGEIHPLSLRFLREHGIDTSGLKNQSWHEFEHFQPHAILTMCDQAAEEVCPVWFGASQRQHWGLTDPSRVTGSDEDVRRAFQYTIKEIERRVKSLLEQDVANMDSQELAYHLKRLAA